MRGGCESPLSMRTVSYGNGDSGYARRDPNAKIGIKIRSWRFCLRQVARTRIACTWYHSDIESTLLGVIVVQVRRVPTDGHCTSPGMRSVSFCLRGTSDTPTGLTRWSNNTSPPKLYTLRYLTHTKHRELLTTPKETY
jgi:hypothetical protein